LEEPRLDLTKADKAIGGQAGQGVVARQRDLGPLEPDQTLLCQDLFCMGDKVPAMVLGQRLADLCE
jgi:hypothetical protein